MDDSSRLTRIAVLIAIIALDLVSGSNDLGSKVISAINCGGSEALGAYGILYGKDTSRDGHASDAGMQFMFSNANPDDLDIYQTERWSPESFSYKVPAKDGEYVVILKLSEVYFQTAGQKVFHIMINYEMVVRNLDIFAVSGGRGYAYDVYIPVVVKGDIIVVQGVEKEYNGEIVITFAKGPQDNPKANGFAVVRGTLEEMPPAPHGYKEEDDESYDMDDYDESNQDFYKREPIRGDDGEDKNTEQYAQSSTGKNPYDEETSFWSSWFPIGIAILVIFLASVYQLQGR